MIHAWGTKRLLFTSLETTENRTRRKITVSLEFTEYESTAGIVQDRQKASTEAQQSAQESAPAPIVSGRQRRGLGSMEARYGNR
jgi:hypothetical protein